MKTLTWIEKELARRYVVGAIFHVNKDLKTHGSGFKETIDVNNIFFARLNELALVYKLDQEIPITECKLCRREVEHPDLDVCIRCTMQKDEHTRKAIVDNLVDDFLENR